MVIGEAETDHRTTLQTAVTSAAELTGVQFLGESIHYPTRTNGEEPRLCVRQSTVDSSTVF